MKKQKTLKCGWCGQQVGLTKKDAAAPHMNGAERCVGTSMKRIHHEQIVESRKPAR